MCTWQFFSSCGSPDMQEYRLQIGGILDHPHTKGEQRMPRRAAYPGSRENSRLLCTSMKGVTQEPEGRCHHQTSSVNPSALSPDLVQPADTHAWNAPTNHRPSCSANSRIIRCRQNFLCPQGHHTTAHAAAQPCAWRVRHSCLAAAAHATRTRTAAAWRAGQTRTPGGTARSG